jgi:hypothetical protein
VKRGVEGIGDRQTETLTRAEVGSNDREAQAAQHNAAGVKAGVPNSGTDTAQSQKLR